MKASDMIITDPYRITAFDLSTTCTGVANGTFCLERNKLYNLGTFTIIPDDTKVPEEMGFLPTKRKVHGKSYLSYIAHKEEKVSKSKKDERDSQVRHAREDCRVSGIIKAMDNHLTSYKPSLVIMETNMAFRSMDITRVLAELSGALYALVISKNIPLLKLNVHTVRAKLDLSNESVKLAQTLSEEYLRKIDLTKETVRHLMELKYRDHLDFCYPWNPGNTMTYDEADALLLLDHWILQNKITF